MLVNLKEQLQESISAALAPLFSSGQPCPAVDLEIPNDKQHGEFATNIALKSARILRKKPIDIAHDFCAAIQGHIDSGPLKEKVSRIEVKNPGFINFYLSHNAVYDILYQVFEQQEEYGRTSFGQGKKLQLEFVSANPTGPLSVAHARQAAVGDALANILNFSGFNAQKEYYVNDEGNQINILGRSIQCRARQVLGEDCEFPEEGYQGDYIRDMAQDFMAKNNIENLDVLNQKNLEDFSQYGVDFLLSVIKKELDDFGVHFDVWAHQSRIATQDQIDTLLAEMKEQGHLYDKDGALWFKSVPYGDDKDRVVRKSDGSYTYFTPDIVYHKDKFQRGVDEAVNIWGPDHHGYIPRLTAAVEALGQKREALKVLIVQLATIYRNGEPVSMSTRRGQYISLREVMDEVGVDAARFFFLMRHIKAHLDFDLELAKKETSENPVYYIQYAHARIYSIVEKAKKEDLSEKTKDLNLLIEEEELDLIKKIGSFSDILEICCREMDPYALTAYLHELATCFHRFYDRHRVVDANNSDLSSERLALIDSARIVIANGLRLLGVSQPNKM